MAWERRSGRTYYYRKRRLGDQVISEYVGAGQLAETAAALDTLEQELRRAERAGWETRLALDARIDEVCDLLSTLAYAALLAAGYHQHRGQWRVKRDA
jgi:hypothetical protein